MALVLVAEGVSLVLCERVREGAEVGCAGYCPDDEGGHPGAVGGQLLGVG